MLGVAGTALAFGGIFNHGSKSTTYKGGVDAIGVHFGGEKKTADITADTPSCPEHSEWNGSVCECNLGWTLNEETNECECPEERRCGTTCCGESNICVDEGNGNKWCCHENYAENEWYESVEETGMCCRADESHGFSGVYAECCPLTSFWYMNTGDGYEWECCPHTPDKIGDAVGCCNENETPYARYINSLECCEEDVSCVAKNAEGECMQQACCPAGLVAAEQKCWPDGECEYDPVCCPPEQRTDLGNMYVCCEDGKVGYCAEKHWEDTDMCYWSGCCAPDKLSYNEDGTGVCAE